MKLYRYRPLSEFLFKELLYSEIYLASPTELNDPLDLNGQLNYFSDSEDEIRALVRFIFKQAFVLYGKIDLVLVKNLMNQMSYEKLGLYITADFSNRNSSIVTKSDLFDILSRFYYENTSTDNGLEKIKAEDLFSSLDELFTQFLNNSSVACFSECNTNFLMWSHYASGHTGICLEFEVGADPQNNDTCHFPILSNVPFEGKCIEYLQNVRIVRYPTSLSKLKFYDYLPVFDNAGDADLMNLSKSYWHQYANGIEKIFLEKLKPWAEEKEWRLVHVGFQETMAEDRILKFNSGALTGVYFGAKASKQTQARVRNILENSDNNPVFYKCSIDGTRGIGVEKT